VTIKSVKITLLMDNRARPGFHAEHGFSAWIEADGARLLFDVGQSGAWMHNAEKLGIDPAQAEAVILSHGHYDHTGSLAPLLQQLPAARLYLHPAALQSRFSLHPGQPPKQIGIPAEAAEIIQQWPAAQRTLSAAPQTILPGIGLTGTIPRNHPLEDTGGPFFLDPAGTRPDPIEDDQSLYIETARGLIIITGCCHAGLINTLEQIQKLTRHAPICAIIGGLHLHHASQPRLEATLQLLKHLAPTLLVPCHCTGEAVMDRFKQELPACTYPARAGNQITFTPQGIRQNFGRSVGAFE
jgi:7,8-dihydropterin-6-yl-methyl-4-(beta-D-ribofuranosyl)aminobenzene 5'-phosphate synthase